MIKYDQNFENNYFIFYNFLHFFENLLLFLMSGIWSLTEHLQFSIIYKYLLSPVEKRGIRISCSQIAIETVWHAATILIVYGEP